MSIDLEQQISLPIVVKLPGVGFHPWMEVNVLRQDLLKATEAGKRPEDALESWLRKAGENLVGYWLEYLAQRLVLPIDLEIAEVRGQKRVVSKGNKDAIWVDSIGDWERNGSVKDSAIKIEEFLLRAPACSAAVLVGPGGYEYPDTQTYIFWIDPKGELESMTIRTDPDIEDNESFLLNTQLNFEPDTDSSLESRVEKVIRSPLFLTAQNGFAFSPESIIEAIRTTKKGQNAFKDKEFENLFSDFINRHELLEAGRLVETVIDEFINFCTRTVVDSNYNLNEIYSLIEEKLGETVLKMSYIKRHLQEQKLDFHIAVYRLNSLNPYDYQDELRYLQTIPGCAGGGLLKSYIENGFGFRETKWEYHSGTCQNCGSTKDVVCGFCKECGKKMAH